MVVIYLGRQLGGHRHEEIGKTVGLGKTSSVSSAYLLWGRLKAGFEFREIKVRWQIFNDLDFVPRFNIAPSAAVRVTGDQ